MLSVVKTSIILVYNLKLVENILRNGIGKQTISSNSILIHWTEGGRGEEIREVVFWGVVEIFSLFVALNFICISSITFLYILCINWANGS